MVLDFRGVAHPPAGVADPDVANLSAAEIGVTNLTSTPVLFEHDSKRKVGHCLASWQGRDGSLRVAGRIDNPEIERSIRSGRNQGLSLGTDVISDMAGNTLVKSQQELSVCQEPRRRGCYIDSIDGKDIRRRKNFSAGESLPLSSNAACDKPPIKLH